MRNGIALDLGGTKLNCALIREDLHILEKFSYPTPQKSSQEIIDLILSILTNASDKFNMEFIGIDVPGIVKSRSIIESAPNLPDFTDIPLAELIEDKIAIRPVIIDDRTAFVTGEYWYFGKSDMVVLLIGTGIGAGIVSGGRIITGSKGLCGIIGWNTSVETLGMPTKVGFLEEKVSGRGIEKSNSENGINPQRIFERYDLGDKNAVDVLDDVVKRLSVEIINIENLLGTELFVLNGKIGLEIGKRFIGRMNDIFKANSQPYLVNDAKIEISRLKEKSPLIGSAIEALKLLSDCD